ncbi:MULTISPECIES: zinc ribbon domain-containing protein [unclassified Enterococcus]|uniref:zinc ribbon domain-containing protein n=1 Tax=unclassified Enterococcus TaxID=2608891 RepID=UPI001CE033A2|nr:MULTISPECIES: zinc ribbon domain-containing protein [unclassified Enterococcus]MCA5011727.1 zinc ribbon domain-containing protein [Enterococcus sp. S23]MCA5014831.1 zinc ribbon domain-containing protein [Enterococcus sp. S22(2020)]
MEETLVQNQCSACGGAINDPSFKNCPHCGTTLDMIQKEIDEKNKNIELCANCGSPVTFNIEKQQFSCDFCHSTFTTKAEQDFDNLTYEADDLIPFQVPEGLAKKKFYEWLIAGENVPLDILGKATSIQLEQVYIPYLGASVSYEGSWSADIGYNRSETYTEYVTKEDKNGNKYTEPVTKTRTVVDWNHSSDIFTGTAYKSYLINNELTGAVAAFAEKASGLAIINEVKPFDAHYTAGTRQLKISSDKVSEALRSVRGFAHEEARKKMKSLLPGDKNKNEKITKFSYTLISKYTYVPFWKITYKYEGIDHMTLMTASKKEKIDIDGSRPVSQEDSTIEKGMKRKGRYGLFASLGFFLVNILGVLPDEAGPFLAFLVIGGIGVWLFFAIKRHRFLGANKKNLKNNLQEHPEYMSLLKQYSE